MKQYDYLIVGAGLYGAVFAQEAKKAGKKCLVIDKRGHIAGNIYTEQVEAARLPIWSVTPSHGPAFSRNSSNGW